MNLMRRLVGGGTSPRSSIDASSSTHSQLGLMHLRKLFHEFSHPTTYVSDEEKEKKLYQMLPLFDKIFSGSSSSSLSQDRFPDLLPFATHVSRLLVTEIRKRAANQSTEAASQEIIRFLELPSVPAGEEAPPNGWLLMSCVHILASGNETIVDALTATSVPSCLVKALYLFFDLPPIPGAADSGTGAAVTGGGFEEALEGAWENAELSAPQRRLLLQKVFVETLTSMCQHVSPAEDLSRHDDLTLLFAAVTSPCPPYNVGWRKGATEVLMTLSRHGLSSTVVSYIHNRGCIGMCLDNVQRSEELSPLEIVEMLVSVFCFLKDSSDGSQVLLEDFRNCGGYTYLTDFLLRLEKDHSEEARDAVRNLVLIVASLSMCGFMELKPTQSDSNFVFQLPGFSIPQPSSRGASVRNVSAFAVLQTVFMRATSINLTGVILDAISSVYQGDHSNYFILEQQNTLCRFAEKIFLKPREIQEKFFQLVEFLVMHLNFVPCKELVALSLLLKAQHSVECSILCINTLSSFIKFNPMFKDVFREVGILEVLVTCLNRFAGLLKEKEDALNAGKAYSVPANRELLGILTIDILSSLLAGNASNASVFSEAGGPRCIQIIMVYEEARAKALGLFQQLMLTTASPDDLTLLLSRMHSTNPKDALLKIDILKAVMTCLRESHRIRSVFRRIGGFVYVLSVLVSVEGCLSDAPSPIATKDVLNILHAVFHTLALAMRFEPGSAKYFHQEICYSSLTSTVRLLGCFSSATLLSFEQDSGEALATGQHTFQNIFTSNVELFDPPSNVPPSLCFACVVLRLLYDLALDAFEKPQQMTRMVPPLPRNQAGSDTSWSEPPKDVTVVPTPSSPLSPLHPEAPSMRIPKPDKLALQAPPPDLLIVHPGVVLAILHLLPSIQHRSEKQMALTLQLYCLEILKSLVRSERNQQVMCDAGLLHEILSRCSVGLEVEGHPLHGPLQYIWERLAAHLVEPGDLRTFLRLSQPSVTTASALAVPVTRVQTLVSMASPKEISSNLPPFVEFDMSQEGFGCLHLPSIAPQSSASSSVVSVSSTAPVLGGIGSGDRPFPPQTGLTFSTWVCVMKYSNPRHDPHPVRLLTLVRTLGTAKDHVVCLTMSLSPKDKALVVTTLEKPLRPGTKAHPSISSSDPEFTEHWGLRVWSPDLLVEGQWHHLVGILNRAALKNSTFSLYVDGQHVATQKLYYIPQNPLGSAAASSVYGYIGTPPQLRRTSRLLWRQGPCHLIEECLGGQTVNAIYQLGPTYTGSFQAITRASGSLISEDKIVFGLNALAMSQLTLARIRKVYSKMDSKSIAKQLGMSTHENTTPIRIVHNSAGHLSGPARTLGAVVIGYLGVRAFHPKSVGRAIENIGGFAVLLGLVSSAKDAEALYAAVKCLTSIIRGSRNLQAEMERRRGYQILALLLNQKRSHLNWNMLQLILSLVGTVDSRSGQFSIPNPAAFRDLLTDLTVWHEAPNELERCLFEHFLELLKSSPEATSNLRLMRESALVPKLLRILEADHRTMPDTSQQFLFSTLATLLANNPRSTDLQCFGQFLASTLPSYCVSEKHLNLVSWSSSAPAEQSSEGRACPALSFTLSEDEDEASAPLEYGGTVSAANVLLRNKGLHLLYSLMWTSRKEVNQGFCDEVVRILGYDWLLLFMQGHLHDSTVSLALPAIILCLSHPTLLQRFRDSCSSNGCWLADADSFVQSRGSQVLGIQVGHSGQQQRSVPREIQEEALMVPGFQALAWLVVKHSSNKHVYFHLLNLVFCQTPKAVPPEPKFDIDYLWTYIFGAGTHPNTVAVIAPSVCPEGIVLICGILRKLMFQASAGEFLLSRDSLEPGCEWLEELPANMLSFLMYLYHNLRDFASAVHSPDVLSALSRLVFPLQPCDDAKAPPAVPPEISSSPPVMLGSRDEHKGLVRHPARRYVMDFLRMVVFDSFSFPFTGKGPTTIDCILEALPEDCEHSQLCEFQTDLLGTVMDHISAVDVLNPDGVGLPVPPGGSVANVPPNVFYFAGRLVDKLWQGFVWLNPQEILDFVIRLVQQAKKRHFSSASLEPLFRSLNRLILFLLSQRSDAPKDSSKADEGDQKKNPVLETLEKLVIFRGIIFGASNQETEFIGCLIYCLLQLTQNLSISSEGGSRTTWHVDLLSISQSPSTQQVHQAASRVWEEVYVCKKPAIEEVFRVTLPVPSGRCPPLGSVRELLHEPASRSWGQFIDGERRSAYKTPWESQHQIQTVSQKLQKMTSLARLAARTKRREESLKARPSNISFQEFTQASLIHIALVKELRDFQHRQAIQSAQYVQKYVLSDWSASEAELFRERGLWGPLEANPLQKFILDTTEGPCRMRKKLVPNERFYVHFPYRSDIEKEENRSLKYRIPTSFDSKKWAIREGLVTPDGEPVEDVNRKDKALRSPFASVSSTSGGLAGADVAEDSPLSGEMPLDSVGFQGLRSVRNSEGRERADTCEDEDINVPDEPPETSSDDNPDNQTVLRLLESGEKISHMFRAAKVSGLDSTEGLLLFGKEHYYFVEGFTLLKTREIRDIDHLPVNLHEPIVPSCGTPISSSRNKKAMSRCGEPRLCHKFAYEDIREVHRRRYLLQGIALEVFNADGRNYLLAFPRGVRNKVYQKFLGVATGLSDDAKDSVAGQRRGASVEQASGLFSSLIGETSVTQRWVRGEISNFQYLMHLNTLAGRSYNDLMQYPVFPWILSDYVSDELDLANPRSFRDLSKPMGAQTPDRLEQFRKRYVEWDDPTGETPPYHYGTHYSSAMIVCSFLVRMEPFTQHFLKLQGGHFDLPDRMFHSVNDSWMSASKTNMADVKELIPEFFYLPDFLLNNNNFDLGAKQSGIRLHHVLLPPWAKGDAKEFIRMHRQALECDYVSSHLHLWIDLIFGYRQSGPSAVESFNVFHHLFYEGNVDIYSIEDPLKKNATIGFINNFGQVPKQLFKRPHPAKKVLGPRHSSLIDPGPVIQGFVGLLGGERLFYHHVETLRPTLQPVKELKGPVGQIIPLEKSVAAVEQNKVLIPPLFSRTFAWGYADQSLRIGNYENEKASFISEPQLSGEVLTATCPNGKIIITGGTNTAVHVWEYTKKNLVLRETLYGHSETVTSLAASSPFQLIVSGSRDGTCILWDLSRLRFIRQLEPHLAPVAAIAINDATGNVATCAGTWLYFWTVSGDPIASVNTEQAEIPRPLQDKPISGRPQQILCVTFSTLNEWDPQNVIMTGSSDGVVRMWSLEYVQVPNVNLPQDSSMEEEDEIAMETTADASSVHNSISADPDDSVRRARRRSSVVSELQSHLGSTLPGLLVGAEEGSSVSAPATVAGTPLSPKMPQPPTIQEEFDPPPEKASFASDSDDVESEPEEDRARRPRGSLVRTPEFDSVEGDDSYVLPSSGGRKTGTSQPIGVPRKDPTEWKTHCPPSPPDHADLALGVGKMRLSTSFQEGIQPPDEPHSRRQSDAVPQVNVIAAADDSADARAEAGAAQTLKNSKSESCLADSHATTADSEILGKEKSSTVKDYHQRRDSKLREGFRWEPRLSFRGKLTMHTAYGRRDNAEPASITALAVSRDHRCVYVGDSRGRVFSWCVYDQAQRPGASWADHWVRNEMADACCGCNVKFSFTIRRHHCRNCGQVFCLSCSQNRSEISRLRIPKPVRVCQRCFRDLQALSR